MWYPKRTNVCAVNRKSLVRHNQLYARQLTFTPVEGLQKALILSAANYLLHDSFSSFRFSLRFRWIRTASCRGSFRSTFGETYKHIVLVRDEHFGCTANSFIQ